MSTSMKKKVCTYMKAISYKNRPRRKQKYIINEYQVGHILPRSHCIILWFIGFLPQWSLLSFKQCMQILSKMLLLNNSTSKWLHFPPAFRHVLKHCRQVGMIGLEDSGRPNHNQIEFKKLHVLFSGNTKPNF